MALDYDGASDGIFTHLGAIIAAYDVQGATAADLDLELQEILDPFQLGDRDLIVAPLPPQVEAWKAEYVGRRSFLAGIGTARLQQRESVLEEIGAVSTDIVEILTKLHHKMIADSETIRRNTVTIGSVTAGVTNSANTGNGTIITTKMLDAVSSPGSGPGGAYPACPDYLELNSELAFNESMLLRCVTDSDTDGVADGSETFLWTGGPQHTQHGIETNKGSGTIGAVPCAHAAQLLANLDFEDYATAHTPDSWTISTGTAGTHIRQSTAEFYHGASSLRLTGDGSLAAINLYQTLTGVGTSVRAGKLYCVTARIKADATIAAGTLTIQFEGTGFTASSTEKIEIAPGDLPTSWTLYSFWIVMPDQLASDFKLVVKWTGTPTNTKNVYVDDVAFDEGRYGGGIAVAVIRGSTPFAREDQFTWDVTNDEVSYFATFFRDVFGVQLPSAASPTISDALAG